MLKDEMCWVIKNQEGYYVNPKFGALFDGYTTGFVFYGKKEILKKNLKMLGEGYYSEYLNLKDVPQGERVYIKYKERKKDNY